MFLTNNLKLRFRLEIEKNRHLIFYYLIILLLTLIILNKSISLDKQFLPVVLLPLTFCFTNFLFGKYFIKKRPGHVVFNIVSFFRYIVLPYVIITNQEYNQICNYVTHIPTAVGLLIFEYLAEILVLMTYRPPKMVPENTRIKRLNKTVVMFVLLVSMAFIYFNRSNIGNLSIYSGVSDSNNQNGGIFSISWDALTAFLFVYLVQLISDLKGRREKVFFALILSVIYLLLIYTSQYRISRWYTIVSVLSIMALLIKSFPRDKNTVLIGLGVPLIMLILVATILKNTTLGLGAGFGAAITHILNPTNLDIYFAGPGDVSVAIALKENYNLGLRNLVYDILFNMPYINSLIDRSQATVAQYNYFVGRNDLIIPLLSQSFIFFGYLFTPLLSILSVVAFKTSDEKFVMSEGINTYLYAFFSVWSAIMPVLNVTIWLSWIYCRIIPAFMLFKIIQKKYNLRRGKSNGC